MISVGNTTAAISICLQIKVRFMDTVLREN
jgi:hypothetical protein